MNLSFDSSDSMSVLLLQPTLQFTLIGELLPIVSPSLNLIIFQSFDSQFQMVCGQLVCCQDSQDESFDHQKKCVAS